MPPVDPVAQSQLAMRHATSSVVSPHHQDGLSAQARAAVCFAFSARMAILRDAIPDILRLSPDKEMLLANTPPIVASVAYKPWRYFLVKKEPRSPVGSERSPAIWRFYTERAVPKPTLSAGPIPARPSLGYFRPEPRLVGRREEPLVTSHSSTSSFVHGSNPSGKSNSRPWTSTDFFGFRFGAAAGLATRAFWMRSRVRS